MALCYSKKYSGRAHSFIWTNGTTPLLLFMFPEKNDRFNDDLLKNQRPLIYAKKLEDNNNV
jgi:hypothetical protein